MAGRSPTEWRMEAREMEIDGADREQGAEASASESKQSMKADVPGSKEVAGASGAGTK